MSRNHEDEKGCKQDGKNGKRKREEDSEAESGEDNMDDLLLNIILAAENLNGPATPEILRVSLEQNFDVKTTNSKIELALENGMRLGVIEEQTKYKLHPEFKSVKDKTKECKEGEDEQEGFSCPEGSEDEDEEGEGEGEGEGDADGDGDGDECEAEGEGDDEIDVDVDVDDDDDGDEEDYKCEVEQEDPHHKCKKQRKC